MLLLSHAVKPQSIQLNFVIIVHNKSPFGKHLRNLILFFLYFFVFGDICRAAETFLPI